MRVAILGSTGSIGTQAIEVAGALSDRLEVTALSAHRNGPLLSNQARALGAGLACLSDPEAAGRYAGLFAEAGVELLSGPEGVLELIGRAGCDLVLNAMVGTAGLPATLAVCEAGGTLALANKESLVAGGRLVMDASRRAGTGIIPVDSEHSAIFQCLRGEEPAGLRRIILTASGGPFHEEPTDLATVTVEQTMAHPTWRMGRKVTVDSATLMNKGLEVLEAHHLFGVPLDDIEVIVHRQSIVHSMVEMADGSVLAQLGVPDMRIPIQYALTFPERVPGPAPRLDLAAEADLTFGPVDVERFPCLALAVEAGRAGGTAPAAMNAANEEAVEAFLSGRIGFTGIPGVVAAVMDARERLEGESIEDVLNADRAARVLARDEIARREEPR
ncbi:MAG: 1-deoxy-D-xylulose-5-phosphate reductoisomerase [Actinomycetota bacterium]